ncbi:CheR family methyltransferase, partial [Caballeronia sp.]|uniref:CheR family methyltransferase n=1 Tax=Caballeronia sp. TaxID=1931223 RepID=UPI003C46E591
ATQAKHVHLALHHGADATVTDESWASITNDLIEDYWLLLNASPDERQALVERLVVPETWFFRDREAFVALARLAHERLARDPARVLRVLSAPCSTGEEPYSIAMALLDAGIGAGRFAVDALDISARVIELASKAVYGRNSFRGHAIDFRERHFSATVDGWLLNERVQQSVHFAHANLFEPRHDADRRYDFIFCRNVLIYFHRDAQDRAISLLDAQLADNGTIFVGPAETGLMMRHAMTSARIPLAFAFQRAPPKDTTQHSDRLFVPASPAPGALWAMKPHSITAPRPAPDIASGVAHIAAPKFAPVPTARKQPTVSPAPAHAQPPLSLSEARRLADAGRLDEAERLAHEFLSMHGSDADPLYLLGLIADARGKSADASAFYRKALYLEPAHYEALTHLAALLDVTGDSAGAQHLTRRAQRAAEQASKPKAAHTDHLRGSHAPRRP